MTATLTRMRAGVSALLAALPAVERRAVATLSEDDAAVILEAAGKTRSRARDLHWSTIEVDRGAPTPLGDDLSAVVEWFGDHVFVDRATRLRLEIDDSAPKMLEQRAQNAVRAMLARALENVHEHAVSADAVVVRVWRDSSGVTVLEVENDGPEPSPASTATARATRASASNATSAGASRSKRLRRACGSAPRYRRCGRPAVRRGRASS